MSIIEPIRNTGKRLIDRIFNPAFHFAIITVAFAIGAYIAYKIIGLPRFIPEGYVYQIAYKDQVFYTDYITTSTHTSKIEFKDIRTNERVQIGSDYIITQVPQEHVEDKTHERAGDLPKEDSGAR